MTRVELLKDWKGHTRSETLGVSQKTAKSLLRQGIAKEILRYPDKMLRTYITK